MGGTSRISREAYVRICEGLGVKLPGRTRLDRPARVSLQDLDAMLCGKAVTGSGALISAANSTHLDRAAE